MKREMEFIGISLDNIIPKDEEKSHGESEEEEQSSEEDTSGGRLRKRKKAPINPRHYRPSVPIALSRTRRQRATPIDYKFSEYDELIEEACDEISENTATTKRRDGVLARDLNIVGNVPGDDRPVGGLGRGKDMTNILKHSTASNSSTAGSGGAPRKKKEYSDDDSDERERLLY